MGAASTPELREGLERAMEGEGATLSVAARQLADWITYLDHAWEDDDEAVLGGVLAQLRAVLGDDAARLLAREQAGAPWSATPEPPALRAEDGGGEDRSCTPAQAFAALDLALRETQPTNHPDPPNDPIEPSWEGMDDDPPTVRVDLEAAWVLHDRFGQAGIRPRQGRRDALVSALVDALWERRGGADWHPDDDARHDELLSDAARIADDVLRVDADGTTWTHDQLAAWLNEEIGKAESVRWPFDDSWIDALRMVRERLTAPAPRGEESGAIAAVVPEQPEGLRRVRDRDGDEWWRYKRDTWAHVGDLPDTSWPALVAEWGPLTPIERASDKTPERDL